MPAFRVEKMLCFACVEPVQHRVISGINHVRCAHCGEIATLEKATDDCFVYIVASAMSEIALKHYSAHVCRFMPATTDHPVQSKRFMIETGRVRLSFAA